jgi:hypothetical protein
VAQALSAAADRVASVLIVMTSPPRHLERPSGRFSRQCGIVNLTCESVLQEVFVPFPRCMLVDEAEEAVDGSSGEAEEALTSLSL